MTEETLFIIKPDAVEHKLIGKILTRIEAEGFEIVELKLLKLSKKLAAEFYDIHRGKPFFDELVKFISSGKIVVALLARGNAVTYLRRVVGATDPKNASPGTLRHQFGTSTCKNAVHAADSKETAAREIQFFFPGKLSF
ncbi:MAG: nucleoside-diphosphate kinase [bacterium]|nr:nucleoside-diphosphate kinase [bacterium]